MSDHINRTTMEDKDYHKVRFYSDQEGFDYCFRFYSDWQDIEDPGFQKALKAYQKSADELEKYLNLEGYDNFDAPEF